ncbi:hypothetical protein C8J57DRAFT_1517950 [Mycena rebaudengoi]|nr:hypothetical protein C8J57DRAFT_1517950 [Mycena rebaudengoi]
MADPASRRPASTRARLVRCPCFIPLVLYPSAVCPHRLSSAFCLPFPPVSPLYLPFLGLRPSHNAPHVMLRSALRAPSPPSSPPSSSYTPSHTFLVPPCPLPFLYLSHSPSSLPSSLFLPLPAPHTNSLRRIIQEVIAQISQRFAPKIPDIKRRLVVEGGARAVASASRPAFSMAARVLYAPRLLRAPHLPASLCVNGPASLRATQAAPYTPTRPVSGFLCAPCEVPPWAACSPPPCVAACHGSLCRCVRREYTPTRPPLLAFCVRRVWCGSGLRTPRLPAAFRVMGARVVSCDAGIRRRAPFVAFCASACLSSVSPTRRMCARRGGETRGLLRGAMRAACVPRAVALASRCALRVPYRIAVRANLSASWVAESTWAGRAAVSDVLCLRAVGNVVSADRNVVHVGGRAYRWHTLFSRVDVSDVVVDGGLRAADVDVGDALNVDVRADGGMRRESWQTCIERRTGMCPTLSTCAWVWTCWFIIYHLPLPFSPFSALPAASGSKDTFAYVYAA